ncbi:hypothetical protein RJ640_025711 [Escallonia rubra]|uniref:Uncharacterized protein n=1 Tax=Escallonia rubra TaxID=112253 RepID=A0AA88RP98_9ASTE|nr:hypothetical protein RJ640_025711 [Escallonia rubra]
MAAQLAAQCLSPDPKARPLMSEVVQALKPMPNLKDMASSSSHFQAMLADHAIIHSNARNGVRVQAGLQTKNGQAIRSLSMPNGQHPSPYRHSHSARSPKPTRQLHQREGICVKAILVIASNRRRDFLPKEYWVQSWEEDEFTNEDGEHLEEETLMHDENEFPTSEAKEIEETKAEQEFKAFKASENDKLTNGEEPVEKIEESENTDGDDNAQYEEMEDESIDKDVRVHGGQNVNNSGMTFDVSLREENVVGSFPLYSLSNFEEESNDYFLMAKNDVIVPQEYAAKVDVLKTYFIENHPRELFFMTRKDNDFVESRTSYYPQLGVENLLSDTGWVNMEMFFDLEELLEMSRENGQDPICTQVTKKCQRCNKKMCHMQYTSKEMAKKIIALDGIGDVCHIGTYQAPQSRRIIEDTNQV